jgi:hypothetical protein
MANLNLLDLVTLQNNDIMTGLVEDVTTYAPEFSQIPVVRRPGITYKVAQRTSLPTAGFRDVNQGVVPSKSAFKQIVKEMFFLDVPIQVDEAIVKADDRSTGDVLSHEAQGALQSALITIGSQTWYGNPPSDSSNGFVGIRQQLSGIQPISGSLTGGAQASATTSSACYGLWLNPWGVSYDVGRDGEIALPPFQRQQIAGINGTGVNYAWVTNLSAFIGLSVKSAYSAWAITGITTSDTATVSGVRLPVYTCALTDAAAAQMVSQIPLNRRAGLVWFMNRQTHFLLQQSRSSLNFQTAGAASGTGAWAPPPTAMEGFPIIVTDSITNTENNS